MWLGWVSGECEMSVWGENVIWACEEKMWCECELSVRLVWGECEVSVRWMLGEC